MITFSPIHWKSFWFEECFWFIVLNFITLPCYFSLFFFFSVFLSRHLIAQLNIFLFIEQKVRRTFTRIFIEYIFIPQEINALSCLTQYTYIVQYQFVWKNVTFLLYSVSNPNTCDFIVYGIFTAHHLVRLLFFYIRFYGPVLGQCSLFVWKLIKYKHCVFAEIAFI